MKRLFFSLILILLVAGCVNLPFEIPGISQSTVEKKELGPDIITIENINVIPRASVLSNDQFSVYFEVKNQDENEPVNDVAYLLYDYGLCQPLKKDEDPTTYPKITNGLAPKETKFFDWTFQAPSEETIARLSTVCPIRWKFSYNYTAKSQINVDTIDEGRYWELQRAGNFTTSVPHLSVGRGPVKIYFDFGTTLPARNGTIIPIYIRVEDKGVGALGMIKKESFSLYIPKNGFYIDSTNFNIVCTDYFSCNDEGTETEGYYVCKNSKEIPLINKKSLEIRCRNVKVDDKIVYQKTFYIQANMTYNYDVLGEVTVEVKP